MLIAIVVVVTGFPKAFLVFLLPFLVGEPIFFDSEVLIFAPFCNGCVFWYVVVKS